MTDSFARASFVYIVKGKRVIGYDNAEGKGDHRHYTSSVMPHLLVLILSHKQPDFKQLITLNFLLPPHHILGYTNSETLYIRSIFFAFQKNLYAKAAQAYSYR